MLFLMLVIGIIMVFFLPILIGIITNPYSDEETKMFYKIAGITILIGISFIVAPFFLSNYEYSTRSELYDIYTAECPDGYYWVDIEGRGVLFRSYITSDLKETYTIKYWINNEIHTKMFESTEEPLIIDGTFLLEKIIKVTRYYEFGELQNTMESTIDWKIHLPTVEEK